MVRHEQIIAGKSVLTPREGDDLLEKLEELVKIVRDVMGPVYSKRPVRRESGLCA